MGKGEPSRFVVVAVVAAVVVAAVVIDVVVVIVVIVVVAVVVAVAIVCYVLFAVVFRPMPDRRQDALGRALAVAQRGAITHRCALSSGPGHVEHQRQGRELPIDRLECLVSHVEGQARSDGPSDAIHL